MALPADVSTSRVTDSFIGFNGEPATGSIEFYPTVGELRTTSGVTIIRERTPLVGTVTNGILSIDLPATDDPDLTPSGWGYVVVEKFDNRANKAPYSIFAPVSGVVLSQAVPVAPVEQLAQYVRTVNHVLPDQSGNVTVNVSGIVYNVKDYGAKGDGVTDDTTAIQAAANAAAGGTLFIPATTFLHTGTINLPAGTRVLFAGRKAVLKYTGNTDAVAATTIKGLLIEGGGTIDLSGAGTNAVGLHFYGVWFATVNDLKVIQGPANSTGILVETGAAGSTSYFGSFCVTINNPDLWGTAGQYGIRCMKTPADPNPINSVTHFQVNNGWCSGKNYGLYLSQTSTVQVNGYCVDNAIDGYYVEYSAGVVLKPGELGPVSNWCINFGNQAQDIYLLTPSYVGAIGATQKGYVNTTSPSGQPVQFARGTTTLRAGTGQTADSIPYFVQLNSLYNYSKSMSMVVQGGGGSLEMMSWSDTGGLVVNGGAGATFSTSSGDLVLAPATTTTAAVRPSRLVEKQVSLTYATSVTPDCSLGNIFTLTLTGNTTLAGAINALDGQVILLRFKQDATGGRTVTWGSVFRFAGGTLPTLSTAAGKTDYLQFLWNQADSKFDCIRTTLGL